MKKKIIIGFFLIFAIFAVGSAAIITNLLRSTSSLQNLLDLHKIEDMRQRLNLRVQKVQGYVYLPAIDFSYNLDAIIANIQELDDSAKSCFSCHHDEAVEKDLSYTQDLIQNYKEKLSYIITSASDDSWRADNQKQAIKLADTIIHHVQEMVNRAAVTLQRKTDQAMTQIKRTYLFLSVTMLCTVVTSLLIGQYLTRKITTPIDKLLLATEKLATGELGYTTEPQGNDEFGQLQRSFNAMSLALAEKDGENKALALALQKKIDELSQAQHQLITSEKLASLGLLAGGISHDFNNILCGMIGYIAILKQQLKGNDSAADNLQTLEKSAIRATQLVKKLQTYAGHKESLFLPVSINEVVNDVRQSIHTAFPRGYTLKVTTADDLPQVNGDAADLQELLYNICENAIESLTDDGMGVIEMTTSLSVMPAGQESDPAAACPAAVRISTIDNGQGIPEDHLQKIFDPYFSTRVRSARRGMGLGMAIVFSIVKKHHGTITIESDEGRGTQVHVYLPAMTPVPV